MDIRGLWAANAAERAYGYPTPEEKNAKKQTLRGPWGTPRGLPQIHPRHVTPAPPRSVWGRGSVPQRVPQIPLAMLPTALPISPTPETQFTVTGSPKTYK